MSAIGRMRFATSRRDILIGAAALGALALVIAVLRALQDLPNATIAALLFLLVILVTATTAPLPIAIVVSVIGVAGLNFFLFPPFFTFELAEPQNWVALFVFLVVATVASHLSTSARARAREAIERQHELARLFDLSRDVMLTTDRPQALASLADAIVRRFDLEQVAIALPRDNEWHVVSAGREPLVLDPQDLASVFADAQHTMEFDARSRTYAGHRTVEAEGRTVRLVPLRVGVRPVGILAAAGRPVEPGTLDALGGVVAIGIERAQLLEAGRQAELARRGEELKTALLTSLGHDLRTPLTAIRIAAGNLKAPWLEADGRAEQADLIQAEAERLTTLFQNILDMARIDAGAVDTDVRWVHPSEIVAAARDQLAPRLQERTLTIRIGEDTPVRVDPRLTSTALARILENAADYSSKESPIELSAQVSDAGLLIDVRDHGPGIGIADLPHLFDRFFRGTAARPRAAGVGLGLSIARGLLAAQGGRVWAENCSDGGARFSLLVPAEHRSPPPGDVS